MSIITQWYLDHKTVKIVVVYRILTPGVIAVGFAVWRAGDDDKFMKRGLRETALARLEKKPITLCNAPRMPQRQRKNDESQQDYADALAQRIVDRDDKFQKAFDDGSGMSWTEMYEARRKFLREIVMLGYVHFQPPKKSDVLTNTHHYV